MQILEQAPAATDPPQTWMAASTLDRAAPAGAAMPDFYSRYRRLRSNGFHRVRFQSLSFYELMRLPRPRVRRGRFDRNCVVSASTGSISDKDRLSRMDRSNARSKTCTR